MQNKIVTSDISFVFQGPVTHRGGDLVSNLKSTKRNFPDAEYLLSTWEGADVSVFCHFDKVILNKDPGAILIDPVTGYPNNILRQVVSTANGLKAASSRYAVKIRTDFAVENANFIDRWSAFTPAYPEMLCFSKPVAIISLGCNDPLRTTGLFHCSDFFYFGLKEDLLLYWDVEEQVRNENNRTLTLTEKLLHPQYGLSFSRLATEQELLRNFVQNKYNKQFKMDFRDEFSKELLSLSEGILLNNFVLLDAAEAGVVVPKRINIISKLDHHYIPAEVSTIAVGYKQKLQYRYIRSMVIRYKRMPRQALLTVYSIAAYLLSNIFSKNRHGK